MTAAELIAILQTLNPNQEIFIEGGQITAWSHTITKDGVSTEIWSADY